MRRKKKLEKNTRKATVSLLVIALLFSAIFSPAAFVFSDVAFAASTSAGADAPSTVLDIKTRFETTPLLGQNARFICSVESELVSPETEVSVKLPGGIALVSGDLSWLGDIPAGDQIKIKAMLKAVQVGNWTIHAEAKSRKYPLFHDVEEVHVFVLEDATYIGESPFAPLSVRVETPPMVEEPLLHQGIVPEAGQPSQPSPEPSSPGFVVTGRHWCYISQDSISGHTSDTQQPQSWGNVWIYRTDGVYLGGGITGPVTGLGEGYFSIDIGPNPYPQGFYVVMTPYTTACRVLKPDETDYTSYSTNFYPSSGATTYDVGGWRPPDLWDYMGAWRIYESIAQDHYDRGAWDFMVNEGPGYMPPEVKVHFKMASGHGTHIHLSPGSGIIDIDTEAYSKALDVAQHEYGHWVMYNAYSYYWPPGAGGPHSINRISNAGMAWTEGWADAFPLIVQSYGRWEDWYFEWGTGLSYDLETCPDCDLGDQCEGRVAGALWDVFDNNKDGRDYFVISLPWHSPNHFLDIWSVVSGQTDAKYLEFYQAWRAQGKDRHLLNYCSYQNTIVYDNSPDLTNGYVTPSSGYSKTTFRFYVTYQDIDWDPPGSTSQSSLRSESNPYGWMRLYVYDGGWTYYVMDHYSGNPESAETFYKDRSGFSVGAHDYYFLAYDGISGGEDRYPDSGYLSFQVLPYNVHLESVQDNGATSNLGTITFDGVSYTLPNDAQKGPGTYQATYYPASTYVFDHWETSGGVTVPDPYGGPLTSVTVSDSGTLRAVYKQVVNVHLESRCEDGSVVNAGTITFDGTQYNLPNDVSKPAGTYQATYNPPADCVFLRWETSGAVSVSNANSQTTSVTVSSPGGTLRAICQKLYTVHLESVQDNEATSNVGTIIIDSVSYILPDDVSKPAGSYEARFDLGLIVSPGSDYVFDHWETIGGISVSGATDNPTTVTVSDDGTLIAVYRLEYNVHLESVQDNEATWNLGIITFDAVLYTLPDDVSKPAGSYEARFDPASGYVFDHWEVTGGVSVSGATDNPTTVTVGGDGNLKAVYGLIHHPVVYVDPADLTRNSGEVFSVNVSISDVGGLFGYEISLYYSRSILNGISVELPSDHFLKPQNPSNIFIVDLSVSDDFNSTHGRAHAAVILLSDEPSKSGSGTLFKVTFEAADPGVSELSLEQVILVDANANLIQPDLIQNGQVHVQRARAYFDFGTGSSPVEPGYLKVTEATAYSGPLGYGWLGTSGLSSRDRGAPNNLRRDLVFSSGGHTFLVDLPNGEYSVVLIIGDYNYRHDLIDVYAEGTLKLDDLTVEAGVFQELTLAVTVSDGQLNLLFRDDGGTDANWVINSVAIEPPLPLCNIYLKSVEDTEATLNLGSIIFDGTSYTLDNTISKRAGTYVISYVADGYVLDYWGTSGDVSISGSMVTVAGDGAIKAVYKAAPLGWKFDFGCSSSPVEFGYAKITESTAYSAALGYGWDGTAGLGCRDRGAPDDLRRDLVFSSGDHTFNVDLPNGQYRIKLVIGDESYTHDLIDVYAENVLQVDHLTVNAGTFTNKMLTVTVSDGQLNIRFHDSGGSDPNWVINAITIEQFVPVEQLFDFGTGSSPVESGYVQVTESTAYSAALGYGWDSVEGLGCRDRGAPDDLRRDLVFSSGDHTFNVDLPNGQYTVTLVIGDNSYAHDMIDVYAENVLQVDHLTVDAGTFSPQSFTATVSDYQLSIRFHDGGGPDPNWVINAIIVQPLG